MPVFSESIFMINEIIFAFGPAGFFWLVSFLRFDIAATGRTQLKIWRVWCVILAYLFIPLCIFTVFTMEKDFDYLINGSVADGTVTAANMVEGGYCRSIDYRFTASDGQVYEGTKVASKGMKICEPATGSEIAVQYMTRKPKESRPVPATPVRFAGFVLALFTFFYARKWGAFTKGLLDHGIEVAARDIHHRHIFGVIYEIAYAYDFEGKTYRARKWMEHKTYSQDNGMLMQRHALVNPKAPENSILLLNEM